MSYNNAAAWLDAKGSELRVGPAEMYKPGKGEMLIEILAVAINPVDWAQQELGLLITQYPALIGCDAAGIVVEVGEDVTRVLVGSRVLASLTGMRGLRCAAFQKYAVASETLICPIPDTMTYQEACVIPLALLTAATGLYQNDMLALPHPMLKPSPSNKCLLIWGGATSVGAIAIQLAVASGLEVFTTSSPKNFEFCKALGAKEVFDYSSSTVVNDVVAALQGKDYAGAYEASGMDDGMRKTASILAALGGGFMAPVRQPVKDLPSNVTSVWIYASDFTTKDPKSAKAVWQDFMPAALQSGQIKPAPLPEVIGHGLEALQEGINTWKRGVSAKKIVVEL